MNTHNVVAVTFDKIQNFLFHVIMEHQQESQSDSETLSSIISASRTVSESFFELLGVRGESGIFQGHIGEVLLKCSGVCFFTTDLDKEESMKRLDKLFAHYYKRYQGNLLLKYICLQWENLERQEEKLKVIGELKQQLKGRACLNEIVSRQQEILFRFQRDEENSAAQKKLRVTVNQTDKKYDVFAENINKLRCEKVAPEENWQPGGFKSSETYFRTVIIKADLDGMGALFQNIKRYDVYKEISDILYEEISMDGLVRQVKKIQKYSSSFKIYPLYAAGDDIMFAVPVSGLRQGIEICENMLKGANQKIGKITGLNEAGVEKFCTLSIGVELSENHEPIRYYYERVQRQLDEAKKEKAAGAETVYSKICMNDCVFHHYANRQTNTETKKAEAKEKTPIGKEQNNWEHFLHMLKLVRQAEREGMKPRYYLYGLLNKVMSAKQAQNEIAYSNAILYHLLPRYIDSNNKRLREVELMMMENLLHQLTIKRKNQWEICFHAAQRKKLSKYVQILLVFSDERFDIVKSSADSPDIGMTNSTPGYLRRDFNRVLRYLYDQSLLKLQRRKCNDEKACEKMRGILNMRGIFVKETSYTVPGDKKGKIKKVQIYQTLNISGSLFHRMKKHVSEIERCGAMLDTVNGITEEDYNCRMQQRNEAVKSPGALFFKKEEFEKTAKTSGLWSEDYLDSLLLLYRYKDSIISFKKLYPKKKF